ncbi:hypothetical protein GCM10011411_23290 [Aurantiacibacter arachoides]|nr:hypothetical protein GCM10011411_23290 [Aurantiacibacter arachoides]
MQVRAYNFWASLLEDRNFPSIEDLDPTRLPDFGPHSVLLDFTDGVDDPSVTYVGDKLSAECATSTDRLPQRLSHVPPRSLLSRITDHYMQILANQSPIGFEAEFVNGTGATILYRGILLPFSSDDEAIDFIFGVINWKEMADSRAAGELMLEIDQALDEELEDEGDIGPRPSLSTALTDWADGPASLHRHDGGEGAGENDDDALSVSPPAVTARPSFDLSGQASHQDLIAAPQGETAEYRGLADWLAAARDMARQARSGEERTRAALYEAVGRAWDFALAAAQEPAAFAGLLAEAGIAMQDRAPMTPVVKLVFGADYDKTRLTEYAAVLAFAQRSGIAQGALGDHLRSAEGGLKGVVAAERDFRRGQEGHPAKARNAPRKAIVRKLRDLPQLPFAAIEQGGEEFALVMIRRSASGEVAVLGEVPPDVSLIEKAARQIMA